MSYRRHKGGRVAEHMKYGKCFTVLVCNAQSDCLMAAEILELLTACRGSTALSTVQEALAHPSMHGLALYSFRAIPRGRRMAVAVDKVCHCQLMQALEIPAHQHAPCFEMKYFPYCCFATFVNLSSSGFLHESLHMAEMYPALWPHNVS